VCVEVFDALDLLKEVLSSILSVILRAEKTISTCRFNDRQHIIYNLSHADDLHVAQGPNMEALELLIDE
jgi:hypothetical protein